VSRTHPLYARSKISGFAKRVGTHPGMVVGQLQHAKRMPYTHNRAFLVPVRDIVTATALSDGWGHDLGL
jgi:HTH-type transcriptional regulator/antitoxin HigA